MDVYARLSPDGCTPQRAFTDLAELWAHGVLDDTAAVWMDAGAAEPAMWALTGGESTLLYTYRPPCAGWVALTKGRVRWGRTHRAVKDHPELDIALDGFPGGTRRRVTIVIAPTALHPTPLRVVADSKIHTAAPRFTHPTTGVTVIDLPTHTRPDPTTAAPAPAELKRGLAMAAGLEMLQRGLDPTTATAVQNDLHSLGWACTPDTLAALYTTFVGQPRTTAVELSGGLVQHFR